MILIFLSLVVAIRCAILMFHCVLYDLFSFNFMDPSWKSRRIELEPYICVLVVFGFISLLVADFFFYYTNVVLRNCLVII